MPKLIVSFTSYPGRIGSVKQVLDSLYVQTLQADEIIMWLSEDEFPNKEADLPKALQEDLQTGRFTLRWCDNLGSHKKYYYAVQEYPDDIIVTVDDDIIYDMNMINTLYQSYLQFPYAVSANWVSFLLCDEKGDLLPCSHWILPYEALKNEPSYQLMAIGSRGILYPPGIMSGNVFDKNTILNLCKYQDVVFFNDSWLKIHELMQGVPVVCVKNTLETRRIPKAQYVALKHSEKAASEMGKIEYDLWNKMLKGGSYSLRLQEALFSMKKSLSFISLEEDAVLENVKCRFRSLLNSENTSEIMAIIHHSLMELNRLQAFGVSKEKWENNIQIYQDIMRKAVNPGGLSIKTLSYYALKDYGVVLLTSLYGVKFKKTVQYDCMLAAWKTFLTENPHCNLIYRIGYIKYLQNMKNAASTSKTRHFLLDKLRTIKHKLQS